MLIHTQDGTKIQGECIGRAFLISFRDDSGLKTIDLTIEEAIDLVNAMQKKICTALYAKADDV